MVICFFKCLPIQNFYSTWAKLVSNIQGALRLQPFDLPIDRCGFQYCRSDWIQCGGILQIRGALPCGAYINSELTLFARASIFGTNHATTIVRLSLHRKQPEILGGVR